jgi:uncharacterized protein (TIGR03067 family)
MVFPVAVAFLMSLPPGGGHIKLDDRKVQAVKKESKRLAGTWELVLWGMHGRLVDRSQWERVLGEKAPRMTIDADGSIGDGGKKGRCCRYVLDPTARPKTFDYFCPLDKGGETLASLGIYELNGDEWMVCYTAPTKPRPTDFTFADGSSRIFEVYRRVKDKK